MRNSTYRVVYRSVRQQIKEAMQQFPNLENSNNRDFSIIFPDAPEFKFSFALNERFPEASPKILLNGSDLPTSLTEYWQPTITICQIVNHLHLIALAKNLNYSSDMSQNISFKPNLNSSMPPRFNNLHPDFNSMTENDDERARNKNSRNENETKSEVEDVDEIDLDNIDVDDNSASEDQKTELLNSSEDISDNKYSSIRSNHKSDRTSKHKDSTRNKNRSNRNESFGEEEEEVDIEINIRENNNEEEEEVESKAKKSTSKKHRKFKLKPNANGAAIQNRDIYLDIQELDAVVTESDEQRQRENELEHEFEDEDDDDNGEEDEEEEEIYENNPTFDKMIRKLGYLYLKKNIDTIAYIQQYKELKKLVPKDGDENDFL